MLEYFINFLQINFFIFAKIHFDSSSILTYINQTNANIDHQRLQQSKQKHNHDRQKAIDKINGILMKRQDIKPS